MEIRGNHREEVTEAYYVGLMESAGYRMRDLANPVIGVVNSWSDGNPGHKPFKEMAGIIKSGIWAAGGTPVEFTVPSPCDAHGQGFGMHYILPQRDLIIPRDMTDLSSCAPAIRLFPACSWPARR